MRTCLAHPRFVVDSALSYLLIACTRREPCPSVEAVQVLLDDGRFPVKVYREDGRAGKIDVDVLSSAIATHRGHFVPMLLTSSRIDPSHRNQLALCTAVVEKDASSVELLLAHPKVDPSMNDQMPFQLLLSAFDADVARLLMADVRIDPFHQDQLILYGACQRGLDEFVRMMLADPRCQPEAHNNQVFQYALESPNSSTLDVVLEHPRVFAHINDDNRMLFTLHRLCGSRERLTILRRRRPFAHVYWENLLRYCMNVGKYVSAITWFWEQDDAFCEFSLDFFMRFVPDEVSHDKLSLFAKLTEHPWFSMEKMNAFAKKYPNNVALWRQAFPLINENGKRPRSE